MWTGKLKKLVQEAQEKIQNEMPHTKELIGKAVLTAAELGKNASTATYEKCTHVVGASYEIARSEATQDLLSKTKDGFSKSVSNTIESVFNTANKTSTFFHQTVQEGHLKNAFQKLIFQERPEKLISLTQEDIDKAEGKTEEEKINNAINKLKNRDKVGVTGEILGVVGGAAAGAAAAGTVAAAAGATTILGSTTLGSVLGGVFIASTPVGWVIGSAAAAAALGYGITKLVHSGGKHDQVRNDIVTRLNNKIDNIIKAKTSANQLNELKILLPVAIENKLITEEQTDRMINLINSNKLDIEIALNRIKSLKIPVVIQQN
ncbi:MAG: hypothetical protein HQM07_08255 [Zetaproteobacteria bacterium]|nr:hypothetical protein [Zetaproteobacteria bacterium]